MTQEEIDRMLQADGLYVVGNHNYPSYSQPVVVMDVKLKTPAIFVMTPSISAGQLLTREIDWPVGTYLASGPHSVQAAESLDRKAQDVADLVEVLTHDRDFWRELATESLTYLNLLAQTAATMELRRNANTMCSKIRMALAAEAKAKAESKVQPEAK